MLNPNPIFILQGGEFKKPAKLVNLQDHKETSLPTYATTQLLKKAKKSDGTIVDSYVTNVFAAAIVLHAFGLALRSDYHQWITLKRCVRGGPMYKKKNWLSVWALVLYCTLCLSGIATILTDPVLNGFIPFDKPYINWLYILLPILLPIVIGMLLSAEHLAHESQKEGTWRFDYRRFVVLGLPGLFLTVYWVLYYVGTVSILPSILEKAILTTKTNVSTFGSLFLSYALGTSIIKQGITNTKDS